MTPGLTQASYEEEVSAYFGGMWKCRRVVFQGDINAPLSWLQSPEGDVAVAGDGKALILLEYLQRSGLQPAAPLRAQQQLPTSRPRQSGRAGSRIDLFATSGVMHTRVSIHAESCFSLGTDHDLQDAVFTIRGARVYTRPATGPRVFSGTLARVDHVSQEGLVQMAKNLTSPKPGRAYKDPPSVRSAIRHARA